MDVDDNPEEILAEEEVVKVTTADFSVMEVIASYGWLILIGSVGLYFVWVKFGRAKYEAWKSKRESQRESAEHHKDPDLALKRLQGLEAARQKMQAEHDARVVQHLEKTKQQEENKRLEKISNWEQHKQGLGYHNKSRVNEKSEAVPSVSANASKSKARLRSNDYNPLMGGGGSSGFRPSRPSQSGGG